MSNDIRRPVHETGEEIKARVLNELKPAEERLANLVHPDGDLARKVIERIKAQPPAWFKQMESRPLPASMSSNPSNPGVLGSYHAGELFRDLMAEEKGGR